MRTCNYDRCVDSLSATDKRGQFTLAWQNLGGGHCMATWRPCSKLKLQRQLDRARPPNLI